VLAEAVRQTRLALAALEIRYGASHPELLITRDHRIYMTEVGARMGGDFIGSDLVRLSIGYDFLRGVIEVALGTFTPPKRGPGMAAGVWFYTAATPEAREWIVHPERHPEVIRAELTCDELPELTASGDRSGYFIYRAQHRLQLETRPGAIPVNGGDVPAARPSEPAGSPTRRQRDEL